MTKFILYDGQLSSRPDDQPWLAYGYQYSSPITPSVVQDTSGGTNYYTQLNTNTSLNARAGYSNYEPMTPRLKNSSSFPALIRSQGFILTIRLRINSESHSGDLNGDRLDDRAGFSVTLLGSDKKGIELGFWSNEIWAQQDGTNLRTHSPTERAYLDTKNWITYGLLVLDNTYYLSANSNVVLSGPTKDYQAFNATGLPYNPYKQPNFLFLGDSTTAASSSTDLAGVAINPANLSGPGNDTVTGTIADDVLNGGGGNDSINGVGGNDVLIGGSGNDTVNGGSGSDQLFGQGNADRYLFDSGTSFNTADFGIDTLMDFSSSEGDKVVLDKTSFNAITSAAGSAFTQFASVARPEDVADSSALIVYDSSSGGLFYNQDGSTNGLGSGGQFATLLGRPSLSANDFVIQA